MRVAQPCGRRRLPFGSRVRLPLTRDDLQRDVEAVPLVAGDPDRARPTAPERAQGPISAEDQFTGREGRDRRGHVRLGFATAALNSFGRRCSR